MDLTKLADKAAADFDHIPYYIAASLTPEEVATTAEFLIGDGKVYGGYLNYPLDNAEFDPKWMLIPMAQTENELMEPRLKSCGFTEQGIFECNMNFFEVLKNFPNWLKAAATVLVGLLVACCLLSVLCFLRHRGTGPKTSESHRLYFKTDSPSHTSALHEYRQIEQREFSVGDTESRQLFRLRDYSED